MLGGNVNYVAEHVDDRLTRELTLHQQMQMNIYLRDFCEWSVICPLLLLVGLALIISGVVVSGKTDSGTQTFLFVVAGFVLAFWGVEMIVLAKRAVSAHTCYPFFCACTKSGKQELERMWRSKNLTMEDTVEAQFVNALLW